MGKHTPGPLQVGDESPEGAFHIRGGVRGQRLGLAYSAADARLWASAPLLLDALRDVVKTWHTPYEAVPPTMDEVEQMARSIEMAEAAIAEAEGE